MPIFDYTVLDKEGKRRHGTIDAPGLEVAKEHLRGQGLTPLIVEPVKEPLKVEDIFARFRGVPHVVLVYFFRQLSTMIDAGIGLVPALLALEEGEENIKFKEALSDIVARVQGGERLAEALGEHPTIFASVDVAMVRAGEASGDLEGALQDIATHLESSETIRKSVRSAMYYPIFVSLVAFVIISVLLIFIVPIFANLFVTTVHRTETPNPVTGKYPHSTALPLPTQIVLNISHIIYPGGSTAKIGYWLFSFSPFSVGAIPRLILLVLVIVFAYKLFKRVLREEEARRRWDAFKLRMPLGLGPLFQKLAIARFSRTFASLLHAGVPAQEAMEIVAETSGNAIIADAVLHARQSLLAGSPIAEPLVRSGVFPLTVTRMIEVGEDTGQLPEMLLKIAEYFEQEVDRAIKGLTSIVEPLLVMAMGVIIGFIIISTYLPMFDLYNLVGTG